MLPLSLTALALALPQSPTALEQTLERAGDNLPALRAALERVADDERPGLEFLLRHMPETDLRTLTADFLVEHVQFAYRAWRAAPWSDEVPERYFFEYVLPYANIGERRDAWRRDFYERFHPLVAEAETPAAAAVLLNQRIFDELGVHYSTKRPKADQSPYESIEAGMASCTGLSVLLISACRAVGVPARFVGTPRWSDDSGNHSWVEIWDRGWHFTGAAEPTGDELDRAWFVSRAADARADSERYGIFATSYVPTPQRFPLVWRRGASEVYGINVTERYTRDAAAVADGHARVRVVVTDPADGRRRRVPVTVHSAGDGRLLFAGESKDERFDANDHVETTLPLGAEVMIEASGPGVAAAQTVVVESDQQLVALRLKPGLTRAEAETEKESLWTDHVARLRRERQAEMEAGALTHGEHRMPFWFTTRGEPGPNGRSLWLSLHGGGGAPAAVNDRQWANQQKLYAPPEGIYVAPRAPTDTWNLWHRDHIDVLFDRLIENMVALHGVDPDRVYLMGYSAGGDGVYQLAPRMADRWAAAAMMAGHPNDARPASLRNTAFTLHMGADDSAYKRNAVAAQWRDQLAQLRAADPEGYDHWVEIHAGKGHWMDGDDATALPWMAERRRELRPTRVVWQQGRRTHRRFYWLSVDEPVAGSRLVVERRGQEIAILEATGVASVSVRLDDAMLDLDRPVVVRHRARVLFDGVLARQPSVLARTLTERGDPVGMWCAEVRLELPAAAQAEAGR